MVDGVSCCDEGKPVPEYNGDMVVIIDAIEEEAKRN